jgi:hypothetical protein
VARKSHKAEMNKRLNDYEFRVENKLCNTPESNPGGLWKILNNFKRLKTKDKIDIDEM